MITQIRDMQNESEAGLKREFQLLRKMIPEEDIHRIFSQQGLRDDYDFIGFAPLYNMMQRMIPRDMTIIDIGCYLAPQSYYFRKHAGYIGVDSCGLERFRTDNTEHFVGTVNDFLNDYDFDHMTEVERSKYYVFITYDIDAFTEARLKKLFPYCGSFYPV